MFPARTRRSGPSATPSSGIPIAREGSTIPVLSASEIAEFVFCPQAWHLSRNGAVGSPASSQRRRLGIRDHALIGRRTDSLLVFRQVQRILLVIILVLATVVTISNTAPSAFSP